MNFYTFLVNVLIIGLFTTMTIKSDNYNNNSYSEYN